MIRFFLALMLFALASGARAGDAATLDFIGFSRDGRFLAFEQFGVQDGSGFPYSEITVVDVATNVITANASVTIQQEQATTSQARAQAKTKAATAFKHHGIIRGQQGRFVEVAAKREQFQSFEFTALGKTFTLELNELEATPDPICDPETPKLLEILMRSGPLPSTYPDQRPKRVLQRDNRLPDSRRCASRYEIHSAFVFGSSLAVFVSYSRTGFEGPDLRWMVVTGTLR